MTNELQLLVVLDNALDAAQVEPLIPAGRSCRTIVTSRRILSGLDGAVHEPLEVLPADDAVTLWLTSLGLTYRHVGRPTDEISAHSEALTIAEPLDETNWLANLICNLAEATRLAQEPEQALAYFERAHEVSRRSEAAETSLDAEIWWGLGRAHADLGSIETARSCWHRSGAILYDLGLISAAEKQAIETSETPTPPDLIGRNT